jgi:hypothetical protein
MALIVLKEFGAWMAAFDGQKSELAGADVERVPPAGACNRRWPACTTPSATSRKARCVARRVHQVRVQKCPVGSNASFRAYGRHVCSNPTTGPFLNPIPHGSITCADAPWVKSGHCPNHLICAPEMCLMNLPASAAQAGKRSLRVDICHNGGCP